MSHLSEQILESFFRRLSEYRQKGRVNNAAYGTDVIGSFHSEAAGVFKLPPVYLNDCLRHCLSEVIGLKDEWRRLDMPPLVSVLLRHCAES